MDDNRPSKVEIIEIGLDETLKLEIERQSMLSNDIQIKLKGQLDGLRPQPINKKETAQRKWEGKLDIIFKILDSARGETPPRYVPKNDLTSAISCDDKELSPLMQKFKQYLRTTKEDKWTLTKRHIKNVTCYSLAPFA
jgi:hypothetical protein